uniref:O-antigen ligase domain-containing protein n=1 Tax=Dictyoglomus thermophilum TaxID=14 RepID=A0A7C3MK95_DICTH
MRMEEILYILGFFLGVGGGTIGFIIYFFSRVLRIRELSFKNIDPILIFFIISFFLSSLFSTFRKFSLLNFLVLLFLVLFYLFFIKENLSPSLIDRVLDYFIFGATLLAFSGINIFLHNKGYYAETPILGKNALGTVLATTIPLVQLKILTDNGKLWHFISLIILIVGLILSMSQGAILGLILAEILIFILGDKKVKRKVLYMSIIALLILVFFLIKSILVKDNLFSFFLTRVDPYSSSKIQRIYIWISAWKMFLDHPIFGVGFSAFSKMYPYYRLPQAIKENMSFAHNLPLNLLAETGILGFLSFSLVIFQFFYWGIKAYLRDKDYLSLAVLSGYTAYMGHQFFDGTMWSLHLGIIFFFFGAILRSLYEKGTFSSSIL